MGALNKYLIRMVLLELNTAVSAQCLLFSMFQRSTNRKQSIAGYYSNLITAFRQGKCCPKPRVYHLTLDALTVT